MKRFEGHVAVISGGADGLGKGIAERIASEGGAVALFDLNKQLLDKAVDEFTKQAFDTSGYVVDVSSEEMVSQRFAQVEAAYGKIDIMINSAGVVGPTSTKITDYATEAFDKIYAVNLRGSFLMAPIVP